MVSFVEGIFFSSQSRRPFQPLTKSTDKSISSHNNNNDKEQRRRPIAFLVNNNNVIQNGHGRRRCAYDTPASTTTFLLNLVGGGADTSTVADADGTRPDPMINEDDNPQDDNDEDDDMDDKKNIDEHFDDLDFEEEQLEEDIEEAWERFDVMEEEEDVEEVEEKDDPEEIEIMDNREKKTIEEDVEEELAILVEEVEEDFEADEEDDDSPATTATVFPEDILVKSRLEEDDVRFVSGTTTDGELADDEGMVDNNSIGGGISGSNGISTYHRPHEDPAVVAATDLPSSADIMAVTGGGAAFAAVLEEGGEDDDNDDDEAVLEEVVAVAAELGDDVAISDEMKHVLREELKYSARDVKLMRPEIATMVVYNKLIRPVEGMPRNWYIDGTGPVGTLRQNAVKIAIATATIAAGAVALRMTGDGLDMSGAVDELKKIPSALAGFVRKQVPSSEPEVVPKTFSDEEMKQMEDEVPHSIKPGSDKPILTGKEDKSALDKFISKIENMIKAFLSIKI